MKKSTWVVGILIGNVALAAAAGGWWWLHFRAAKPSTVKAVEVDQKVYQYIGLDKVIVMLRRAGGETDSHYLAIDIEFKTPMESVEAMHQQLPLLRSATVKLFSTTTAEEIRRSTIEEITGRLNLAFKQAYTTERLTMPFDEALIGKLIVE